MNRMLKVVACALFLLLAVPTVWSEGSGESDSSTKRKLIVTDGKGDSLVKVSNEMFLDQGYGVPGNNSTIQASAVFTNTSKDDLEDVELVIEIVRQDGSRVHSWEKKIDKMAAGQKTTVASDSFYYNYTDYALTYAIVVKYREVDENTIDKEESGSGASEDGFPSGGDSDAAPSSPRPSSRDRWAPQW